MSTLAARSSAKALRRRSDLFDYQVYLADKIQRQKAWLLCVSMGLGKTASSLTAARDLLDQLAIRKVLIVAPVLVAENTWPEEIAAWEHTRVLSYSVLTGPSKKREKVAREDTEIHIINRELVPWLVEFWGKDWPYDMLVWDESSRLKAGRKKTKGGKVVRADGTVAPPKLSEFGAICKVRPKISYVVELTGTPAPNGVRDLWGQIYLLDLGKRLGTSRSAFEDRWFDKNQYTHEVKARPGAQEEIMQRASDLMLCLRGEDYLKLPPLVYNTISTPLPPKAMETYVRLERDFALQEHDIRAVSSGVLTNKLLQLANGSLYKPGAETIGPDGLVKTGPVDVVEFHDQKLVELERIIEEANGKPVLVAYSYQFDLEKLRKRFAKAVVLSEEPDAVSRWNKGEIPILLAHPASAGHGLNLQFGSNTLVWYGLTWSLELYQQFNKRLHRPGQQDTVFIHHIVARGTVDEDVLAVMQDKAATQDRLTEVVRVRLRKSLDVRNRAE